MHKVFAGFPHVMVSQQFNREWLEKELFPASDEMEKVFKSGGCDILEDKKMVSFFYQPSTRTRMSFEMAMAYLKGSVVFSTDSAREFSSGAKGESLKDTIRVINCYRPDVIILRYDKEIGSEIAGDISMVPIINAGDRNPGQHPTQGLLDLRTIKRRFGEIDGLKVTIVGDLFNGRTARSFCYLLGKFRHVFINFVSPEHLKMKDDVKSYLARHMVLFAESTNLRRVIGESDVIYQTRVQTECGATLDRRFGCFTVNRELMSLAKEECIVMHPLPRLDEIAEDVDDDPRAVYLTHQIESGLCVRMALLKMILAPNA